MHINSHTKFQLEFSKFFNGHNGRENGTASLCHILTKSLQPWPRYRDFSIYFKMAAAAILDFRNFACLTVGRVTNVELHQIV